LSFPSLTGDEPELFGQGCHGSDRVLVVARQKDNPVAALDDRIGSQGGRRQVIEAFHELATRSGRSSQGCAEWPESTPIAEVGRTASECYDRNRLTVIEMTP
jgi:hypothetical protein